MWSIVTSIYYTVYPLHIIVSVWVRYFCQCYQLNNIALDSLQSLFNLKLVKN